MVRWKEGSAANRPGSSKPDGGKRADWRKKGAATTGVGATERTWRNRRRPATDQSAFAFHLKLAAWFSAFLVLVGILVYILLGTPRGTPLVALAVTDYEDVRIPPNALAQEDVDRLHDISNKNLPVSGHREDIGIGASPGDFLADLEGLLSHIGPPGGPGKNVVIIYLSAHGMVDDQRRPCLLLSEANPLDVKNWLPVANVIKTLDQKVPANTKKILVLDCNRMLSNWHLGLLYNAFTNGLHRLVQDRDDDNLFILNSASPGQFGWSAPELNGSVFGHFIARGLSGEADADEFGKADHVVTMRELLEYLRVQVGGWVRDFRDDRQIPELISKQPISKQNSQNDFPLVYASSSPDPSHDNAMDAATDWEPLNMRRLEDLWIRHESLSNQSPVPERLDPMGWAELELRLVRLEQLLLAGRAYQQTFDDEINPAQTMLEEFERRQLGPPNHHVRNLELAKQWRLVPASTDGGNSKPPDGSQHDETSPDLAAARVAWDAAEETNLLDKKTLESILAGLNANATAQADADVEEIHFLRMLNEYLDWDGVNNEQLSQRFMKLVASAVRSFHSAQLAVAPPDERAHYFARADADAADRDRRRAENQLFIGAEQNLNLAAEAFQAAEEGYVNAHDVAEKAALALALRDEAWATLPHLCQWFLLQVRHGEQRDNAETCHRLPEHVHRLSASLESAIDQNKWSPSLTDQHDEVRSDLELLKRAYYDRCEFLLSAGSDSKTARGLADALRLPLVTGQARNELRRKFVQRVTQPVDIIALGDGQSDHIQETTAPVPPEDPLEWLAKSVHPALVALNSPLLEDSQMNVSRPTASEGKSLDDQRIVQRTFIAQQEEYVRVLLRRLDPDCQTLADRTRRLLQDPAPGQVSPSHTRSGLGHADLLARAAAPLAGKRPWDHEDDPTRQLRRVDQFFQLLWLARRTLDDFWGPTPNQNKPYFATVAGDYLQAARSLWWLGEPASRDIQALNEQLTQLEEAAERGIQLDVAKSGPSDGSKSVRYEMTLEATAAKLPAGEAAVYLQRDGAEALVPGITDPQIKSEVRRESLDVKSQPSSAPAPFLRSVQNIDPTNQSDDLEGVVLFRGHKWRSPAIRDVVEWNNTPPPPTITVYGHEKEKPYVMFVFDWSGSMKDKIPGEGRRRYEAARTALFSVLEPDRLPDRSCFVGLRLFGHRAGYDKEDQIVREQGAPRDLHPSEDVERKFDFEELDSRLRNRIRHELDNVTPKGVTPLYFALKLAVKDFQNAPRNVSKQIIVITDGENNQTKGFRPSINTEHGMEDVGTDDPGVIEQLLKKRTYQGIQIDILGFLMQEIDSSALETLAEGTGGRFYDVRRTSELLGALAELVRPIEFTVSQADATTTSRREPLGSRWTVNDFHVKHGDRRKYEIQVHDEAQSKTVVWLEGGEGLQLQYDPQFQPRLDYKKFEDEIRTGVDIDDRDDPDDPDASYHVAAHVPKREGRSVVFRVSIQKHGDNSDWAFTPRPRHIWAEITPSVHDSSYVKKHFYYFYDRNFEFEQPVPVLRFPVADWPKSATQAKIQLWFKMKDDEIYNRTPDTAIREALNRPGEDSIDFFRAMGIENVKFKLKWRPSTDGPAQWVVTEEHEAGLAPDGSLVRVEMQPPGMHTVRRFRRDLGRVVHIFTYAEGNSTPTLRITSKSNVVARALALPEDKPLVVAVPEDVR